MRLTVILVIGVALISATYAWMNSSQAQVDNTGLSQLLPAEIAARSRGQNKIVSSEKASKTSTTVTTTVDKTVLVPQAIPAPALEPAKALDNHATSLDVARIQARSTTGQSDPFSPLTPAKGNVPEAHIRVSPVVNREKDLIPPPPPTVSNAFGDAPAVGQLNSGLNLGELPMPPDNAGFNTKTQLVGILGDRAIFSIKDSLQRRRHHWPKTFTLAIGQQFDGMKLTAIKDESVLVEEGGQAIEKPMPVVK